jgi:dTDP-L-rhamnose 4-epimerase
MMHVLVTGGAGFIGRHVRQRLHDAGHEVRVLDSLRPDVHHNAAPGDDVIRADIRDPGAVEGALRDVDAVCHLAAKVGLGVGVHDMPDYADSNVGGTSVLLAAMARAGVHRLVLASSMVVYGEGLGRCKTHGLVSPGPRAAAEMNVGRFEPPCPRCGALLDPALVPESARLDPRNAYAATKVAQEHFAGAWANETDGSVAALRLHNVYGPGMPVDTPYAGVAAVFRSALARGQPPQVFEDGLQRRDFVHVRDVATAFVAAIEQHESGLLTVNVGSGRPRTVGDLAHALARAAGGPIPRTTGEYRVGDVRHITADSRRLRTLFGWAPEVDFDTAMSELTA